MAIGELANAGLGGKSRPRKRVADGNGATVTILPTSDGYVAISPREERQWAAWLEVMGSPDWGSDPRFATKTDRIANWDALYAAMSQWSRHRTKQWIADRAQAAHVPSFPLREPAEQLASPQLAHRHFYRSLEIDGRTVKMPGPPFGLRITDGPRGTADRRAGPMPLSGVRVLDFSWVIAGPTATRYLAAMGAEIIKIEAPGRGDPGRTSQLHTVLGQAKRGIVLDLKKPEACRRRQGTRRQIGRVDRKFRDRGHGQAGSRRRCAATDQLQPDLRIGIRPRPHRAGSARGRLRYPIAMLCRFCRAQSPSQSRTARRLCLARPDVWSDAGLFGRCRALASPANGGVARVDFSMVEAMLWTMAEPLLQTQLGSPPHAARQRFRKLLPAWSVPLRRRRRLAQPCGYRRSAMAATMRDCPRPGVDGGFRIRQPAGTARVDRLRTRCLAASAIR